METFYDSWRWYQTIFYENSRQAASGKWHESRLENPSESFSPHDFGRAIRVDQTVSRFFTNAAHYLQRNVFFLHVPGLARDYSTCLSVPLRTTLLCRCTQVIANELSSRLGDDRFCGFRIRIINHSNTQTHTPLPNLQTHLVIVSRTHHDDDKLELSILLTTIFTSFFCGPRRKSFERWSNLEKTINEPR